MAKWVSVKERLPEKMDTYLVLFSAYFEKSNRADINFKGLATFHEYKKRFGIPVHEYAKLNDLHITHWLDELEMPCE